MHRDIHAYKYTHTYVVQRDEYDAVGEGSDSAVSMHDVLTNQNHITPLLSPYCHLSNQYNVLRNPSPRAFKIRH